MARPAAISAPNTILLVIANDHSQRVADLPWAAGSRYARDQLCWNGKGFGVTWPLDRNCASDLRGVSMFVQGSARRDAAETSR
jgi:hypothetical protein